MNSASSNSPIPAAVATSPSARAQQLLDAYVVPNYGRLSMVPDRGAGCWLWDVEGKKYLDFGGGVAVTSLGHCPAVIQKALADQAAKLIHCSNWYQIQEQGELGKFITETVMQTPGKNFFCNSGAEANEGLIKLARKFGHAVPASDGRPRFEIITFHHSFHGRTYGGISATAQQKVKDGFEPLVPGFVHLDYNDCAALEGAITDRTVAILLEPVQGEGGVNLATPEFLETCREVCQKHNLLLLFDEVQAGLGRCGHWCSWKALLGEDTPVVPDAVSWAKGIGGGFPLGAVWIRQRPISSASTTQLCDVLSAGSHGTTYGGNPLACAVGLAVLEEISKQNLCEESRKAGERIKAEVASWNSPLIRDIRGKGLLLGFELNPEALEASSQWTAGVVPAIFVVKKLMAERLLTVAAGPNVVRWLPPLNVSKTEISEALRILQQVLADLEK